MNDVIVKTKSGDVRGVHDGEINRFLGIPYAASPLGKGRFKLPEPPNLWNGVRDALDPGPNAPQIFRELKKIDGKPIVNTGWRPGDDFLALNVWAPHRQSGRLPVMVFIHGGAFVIGDKDAPVNNGEAFARSGVVCVAINYRMGVEGFLPIEGAPTNLGLRDQIAALTWVRENIEAFGGDPGQVTVFGESAGAMSIAILLASPMSRGLFQRAIIQSGSGSMVRPRHIANRLTEKFAKVLKISPDVDGFRSRSVEQCLKALEKIMMPWSRLDLRDEDGRDPSYGLLKFFPVYGDDVLPDHPMTALANGAGADVDVMIGTNRDEINLHLVATGADKMLWPWLARFILRRLEPEADRVLNAYGLGQSGKKASEVFADATNDLVFRLPARRFAAAHQGKTHMYEFGWRSPACDGRLGACHALELPFVFKTLETCTGPRGILGFSPPQELANSMHAIWVEFATSGQLPWPDYEAKSRQVYLLDRGTVVTDPDMPAERIIPG